MKTTCPNCKYILDFDETEYVPGEVAHLECPMCGQEVDELIKKPEVDEKPDKKPMRKAKPKSDSPLSLDAISTKPSYLANKTKKSTKDKKSAENEKSDQPQPQQSLNNQEVLEKTGCWGIGLSILLSILFPIVGIILYFNQRNKVESAKVYLWCALISFIIGWYFSSR